MIQLVSNENVLVVRNDAVFKNPIIAGELNGVKYIPSHMQHGDIDIFSLVSVSGVTYMSNDRFSLLLKDFLSRNGRLFMFDDVKELGRYLVS